MIRTNSLIFKFSLQLTIIVSILIVVLVASNLYSFDVVRNNTLASARNTLSLYQANIHNYLDNFSKDLSEVFVSNADLAGNFESLDEGRRYLATMQFKQSLASKISANEPSDGLFIRLSDSYLIAQYGNRLDYTEKLKLNDFIIDYNFPSISDRKFNEWTIIDIKGDRYLFKYLNYSGMTFGTFVNTDSLLSMVNKGGNDLNHYVLSDQNRNILTSNTPITDSISNLNDLHGEFESRYLIITEPISEFGDITNLVAKQSLFSKLKLIQWLIALLALLSVVVVPLVLRKLAKDIVKPVLDLVKAAKEVEKGNPGLEIAESSNYSMEFMKLFHSLQSMVREITELKIQFYEEQIERSRAEIKYLQMQLRPHFYLNAISTVTSLTYQNKNEEIRSLIHHLSEHLRYMFSVGLSVVSAEDEVKHTVNYIRMQEIRYPNQLFFMTEMGDEVRQALIPQLMILTFVENSIKHAIFYGEMLSIFIRVGYEERMGELFVKIVIEDNGSGFPSELISSGIPAEQENGTRIGIANVRRTLHLLYKREDLLSLSNVNPSGARVELWIPAMNQE